MCYYIHWIKIIIVNKKRKSSHRTFCKIKIDRLISLCNLKRFIFFLLLLQDFQLIKNFELQYLFVLNLNILKIT